MVSQTDTAKTVVTNRVDNNSVDTYPTSQMSISPTLEDLQTDEQRRILDTVSQVRKCGLESVLSLPQIVVCGDQSSGKSSVLEALTEIPFPSKDNLCTRFATEICLRRDPIDSLTIRVIPDSDRPQNEQEEIKNYSESIADFADLPKIMNNAMKVMGISEGGNAFAKDTLSIEICGPNRPQLTLVDIPGLIQSSTKGVSDSDVAMVAEITDHYIKQPRTICLAVIAATNDAANQPILQRVRKFDPIGDRTLGVITKPDKLSAGSGSETKFLELARNEDVFLKLGWHVIKNRKYEERDFSIDERKSSEKAFFSTSNFKALAKDNVGIDTLRLRLSYLLFEHVKHELPRLQKDLEHALQMAQAELKTLGNSRSTPLECRAFLTRLSMECYDICRSTLNGNYEDPFFKSDADSTKSCGKDNSDNSNNASVRRLRAAVQLHNCSFATQLDTSGQKYVFGTQASSPEPDTPSTPQILSVAEAKGWVKQKLRLARGTELIGNFNPQVIGELFWEQSELWEVLAKTHVEKISKLCIDFLESLLGSRTTWELKDRIW
jgi:GTPase SAR1 family protein